MIDLFNEHKTSWMDWRVYVCVCVCRAADIDYISNGVFYRLLD